MLCLGCHSEKNKVGAALCTGPARVLLQPRHLRGLCGVGAAPAPCAGPDSLATEPHQGHS
jgi:hypothetical protein